MEPTDLQIRTWLGFLSRRENSIINATGLALGLVMLIVLFIGFSEPHRSSSLLSVVLLEAMLAAMARMLVVPRYHNRNQSRLGLLNAINLCEKSDSETICWIATANSEKVKTAAGARLLDVLSEVVNGDSVSLGRYSRPRLHRILRSREPEEVRIVLRAMEHIGQEADFAPLESLAQGKHAAALCPDIREDAARILPILRERAANLKLGTTLLRASAYTEAPLTLLRPSTERPEENQTLLRAGTGEEE